MNLCNLQLIALDLTNLQRAPVVDNPVSTDRNPVLLTGGLRWRLDDLPLETRIVAKHNPVLVILGKLARGGSLLVVLHTDVLQAPNPLLATWKSPGDDLIKSLPSTRLRIPLRDLVLRINDSVGIGISTPVVDPIIDRTHVHHAILLNRDRTRGLRLRHRKLQTLPLAGKMLCLEDEIAEHVLRMMSPLIEVINALVGSARAVVHDLLCQDALLLRKTVLLRRRFHKQEIIRLGQTFCNAELMPRLVLLIRALTKCRNQCQKCLATTRAVGMRLLNPEFRHGEIILPDVQRCKHVVRLPHLLIPTACLDSALLPLNGLIQLAHVLQCLRQLEHLANIVGILAESLGQKTNIAIVLVCLGTSIPDIMDPHALHVITLSAVPVLVRDTHTLPRNRKLHEARVVVLESAVLLNNAIATSSLELGMRVLSLQNHVPIQNHGVGIFEIPTQLLCLLIGSCKGQATVVPKVLPLVLDDLRGTLLEVLGDLASIVRRTRIADDDSVCVTSASLQASLEDLALILDHQGQQEVRHFLW